MIIKVRLAAKESSQKPIAGELEVEIRGPCDTGGIVSTMTGVFLGTIKRPLASGGIEIEVERSVYDQYHKKGWKYAY